MTFQAGGSSVSDEVHVDVDALQGAADGVTDLLGAMATKKVSDIDADKSAFGHEQLGETVADFCERWNIGVEHLAEDAQGVAVFLGRCVYAYRHVDRASGEEFTGILELPAGPDPAAQ